MAVTVEYKNNNPAAIIRRGLQTLANRTVEEFTKNYKEHDELAEEIAKIPINQVLFYDTKPEEVELNRVIYVDGYFYRGAEDESTDPATLFWENIGKLLNDDQIYLIDTEEHWNNLGFRPEGVVVYFTDENKLVFHQDDDNEFLINDSTVADGEWKIVDWTIDYYDEDGFSLGY